MATIDDEALILEMIKNDGYYEGDPRVHMIVEYRNAYGRITWGVTWQGQKDLERYLVSSDFVHNPQVIWRAK